MWREAIKKSVAMSPARKIALSPAWYLSAVGHRGASRPILARLPVRVPMDLCVGYTGFPYRRGGWHYLVELLRQVDRAPDLAVGQSILARFHVSFTPDSAYHLVAPFAPDVKFRPPLGVMPWGHVDGSADASAPFWRDWTRSRWYGPSAPDVVADEYTRMLDAYVSILQEGYDPWRRGFIGGQFLRAEDGSLRYVILQGNHRAAILAHLGCRSFVARAVRGRPAVIDERDLAGWPYVTSGACSPRDARAYFHAYFAARGFEQGHRYGLLE